ncbi:hypothetical protein [Epibacterium ulvae]|uniref:hypothetical protein n=1 Tax=Epibacterium ulvae TaxID=1156985 RepID=UPI0024939638|nr:hypothetical protein [Epibacterium ulvae]
MPNAENIWTLLKDHDAQYLVEGAILRFRTIDTAGNHYKYAIATRIDAKDDLGFVALHGTTWGYGRCTLPVEARRRGQECTIDKDWLLQNFIAVAEPEDLNDIWVCDDAMMR